jgi:hypothetical protein
LIKLLQGATSGKPCFGKFCAALAEDGGASRLCSLDMGSNYEF